MWVLKTGQLPDVSPGHGGKGNQKLTLAHALIWFPSLSAIQGIALTLGLAVSQHLGLTCALLEEFGSNILKQVT